MAEDGVASSGPGGPKIELDAWGGVERAMEAATGGARERGVGTVGVVVFAAFERARVLRLGESTEVCGISVVVNSASGSALTLFTWPTTTVTRDATADIGSFAGSTEIFTGVFVAAVGSGLAAREGGGDTQGMPSSSSSGIEVFSGCHLCTLVATRSSINFKTLCETVSGFSGY